MQIVSSKQMSHLEKVSFQKGASQELFMEKAGLEIAKAIQKFSKEKKATLLIGKGNNGGDGFVAGRELIKAGWKVEAIVPENSGSALNQKNREVFLKTGGTLTQKVPSDGILIDALFGTGFHGKPKEPYASLIQNVNCCHLPIFSIDLPSGLNGDTGSVEGEAISADYTLYLGLPKKGFFLQAGWNHIGKLIPIDFGLDQDLVQTLEHDMTLSTPSLLKPLLPPVVANQHKYQRGVVVALAGSPGMPGAAQLACLGALRAGAGLVRLLHPSQMAAELSCSPYELIRIPYDLQNPVNILQEMEKAQGILVGPGIGRSSETKQLLKKILEKVPKNLVIDADAITLIAEEKLSIPKGSVLTPHIGEMIRLLPHMGPKPLTSEFLHTCQHFAETHQVTIILKGGPTFILHPGKPIVVSPFGDPGMATAGSGDVLSGIIASLIAQKITSFNASILGTALHGIAGESAAMSKSSHCLLAHDIAEGLPNAFKTLI